jgi:hypothetical protein
VDNQWCNSCAIFPLLVLCSFKTNVQENLISLCKTLNPKVLEGEKLNVHIYACCERSVDWCERINESCAYFVVINNSFPKVYLCYKFKFSNAKCGANPWCQYKDHLWTNIGPSFRVDEYIVWQFLHGRHGCDIMFFMCN